MKNLREYLKKKRFNVDKNSKSTKALTNIASKVPKSSKREQSVIIQDNQLVQSASTEKITTTVNDGNNRECTHQVTGNKSSIDPDSLVTNQNKQEPIKHANEPTEVTNVNQKVISESVSENKPSCSKDFPNTSATFLQRSIPMNHHSKLQDPISQEMSVGRSKEDIGDVQKTRPQKMDVSKRLKAVNKPSQLNQDFQHDIAKNTWFTFHEPTSVKLPHELYKELQSKQSLTVIKKPNKRGSRLDTKTRNMLTGMKRSTKSSIQSSVLPPPTVVEQASPVAQRYLLEVAKEPLIYARSQVGRNNIDPRFFLQATAFNPKHIQRASDKHVTRSNEINHVHHRLLFPDMASNTSATQSLSNLAHRSRYFVEQSHEQQHLPNQEDFAHRFTHIQELLGRTNEETKLGQGACIQETINYRTHGTDSHESNPVNQPSQFLLQNNTVNQTFLQQEQLKQEQLRTLGMATHHTPISQTMTISEPLFEHSSNLLSQLNYDFKHPKNILKVLNHQDSQCSPSPKLQGGISFRTNKESQAPGPQFHHHSNETAPSVNTTVSNVTRASLSTANKNKMLYDLHTRRNEKPIEQNNTNQTDLPLDYQHPPTQIMVDQYTETDFIKQRICREGATGRLLADERSPKLVDSACQVDEYSIDGTSYQEVASDHKVVTPDKIVLEQDADVDNDMCTEEAPIEMVNNIHCTGGSFMPESNINDEQAADQNLTASENQQLHLITNAEQQMLNELNNLFIKMSTIMSTTVNMFNNLRSSIVESAETYHRLVETVQTLNALGHSVVTVSSPSNANVTANVSAETEVRQAGDKEYVTNRDKFYSNSIDQDSAIKHDNRRTFILPPEYDPNDSKWTLKYRNQMPGLVELIPQTGIYVGLLRLSQLQRVSKDCKSFARLLLTEVFSVNALSVCSLAGGITRTFDNVNIEIRPGLDEYALMVLLKYVEEYGLQQGWDESDTQGVMKGIRSKLQEMRANSQLRPNN